MKKIVAGTLLGAGLLWSFGVIDICLSKAQIAKIIPSYKPSREDISICFPQVTKVKGWSLKKEKLANKILRGFIFKVAEKEMDIDWTDVDKNLPKFDFSDEYRLSLINNRFLSVAYYVYTYTGGAHGNDSYWSLVVDMKSEKAISFSDFFKTSELYRLKKLILLHDWRQKISWKKDFFNPKYKPGFYLSEKGVLFLFDKYDVAPGATGSFSILVPYSRLKPFLSTYGKKIVENYSIYEFINGEGFLE
ncbi:MAG: hypothetical protein C6I01_04355 [Epsilonproteobacteria bacterium]|nr:hypothetical protein [Campylobacterota bacterium]NPA88661.1 DUF3298 and DUF4163 domain-containing protein [Campylobacterota bacterium]